MAPEQIQLPDEVDQYLSDHNVLNLSTHDETGCWGSAVFYANSGLQFWFLSNPATRHGLNIVSDPGVAATIHEDYLDWRQIKGLQMTGRARLVEDEQESKLGMRAYLRKYSFVSALMGGLKAGLPKRSEFKDIRLFCFEPDLVLWLDNSAGIGNRVRIYPAEAVSGQPPRKTPASAR